MWKSWRQPPAAAQQSNIMSYDDYYDQDERYLETIHEVESIRERPQSVAHPSQGLPELPLYVTPSAQKKSARTKLTFLNRSVPPLQSSRVTSSVYSSDDAAQRNSRIASSLYSQPSPTYPPEQPQTADLQRKEPAGDEISPISTPRSTNFPVDSDTTISPIEPSFPAAARSPLPEPGFKSQIPRPVASVVSDHNTPPVQRTKKQDTKWDELSGEQTASERGKRGSVRLRPDQLEMQFPQLKERTKQILAGLRDSDSKKTTRGRHPPPVEDPLDAPIQQRPAWKGASGREAVVEPVRNNPGARKGPLHIPQRNVSRDNPVAAQARTQSPEVSAESGSPSVEPEARPVQAPSPVTRKAISPKTEQSIRVIPSPEEVTDVKPIAPLKTRSDKGRSQTDPSGSVPLHSSFQSPPAQGSPLTRTSETNKGQSDTSALVNNFSEPPSTPPIRSSPGPLNKSSLHPDSAGNQDDVSRFSWTTYATTVNDSPPNMRMPSDSSPVPPMPSMVQPANPAMAASFRSMRQYSLNAARHSTASIISRKPVGDRRRSSSMQSSTAKDLPPTPPPEPISAKDRVEMLEAKQEQLFTRKRNNSRIRVELTEALRRNAIVYDLYKRKEVESRIKELELELDEIAQEEHEVGVLLHRAQKKRDNADEYEGGTALWITRVTQ